jgi:hypothetical protein
MDCRRGVPFGLRERRCLEPNRWLMGNAENGEIAELWVTWENLAVLGQLGHSPGPPGTNR